MRVTIVCCLLAIGAALFAADEAAPPPPAPPPLEETMAPVLAEATQLRQLLADLKRYDQETPGISGLGAVGQLQVRAERYTVERRTRHDLETRTVALLAALDAWVVAERQRREAALEAQAAAAVAAAASTPTKEVPQHRVTLDQLDLSSFGYFELKEAATLEEISALPEVYGDGRLWQAIAKLNPGLASDGQTTVPAGTVLKIPHVPPTRDLKYE